MDGGCGIGKSLACARVESALAASLSPCLSRTGTAQAVGLVCCVAASRLVVLVDASCSLSPWPLGTFMLWHSCMPCSSRTLPWIYCAILYYAKTRFGGRSRCADVGVGLLCVSVLTLHVTARHFTLHALPPTISYTDESARLLACVVGYDYRAA